MKVNQKSLSTFVIYFLLVDFRIDRRWCVIKKMAFAVHVNMEHCTGCNNCVVACPVDALELYTVDPATNEKIYKVRAGKSIVLDFKQELCAGCGVCVEACPHGVIRLSGKGVAAPQAKV